MRKVELHHPGTGQTTQVPAASVAIYAKRGWETVDQAGEVATAAVAEPSTPGDGGHHTPEPTED